MLEASQTGPGRISPKGWDCGKVHYPTIPIPHSLSPVFTASWGYTATNGPATSPPRGLQVLEMLGTSLHPPRTHGTPWDASGLGLQHSGNASGGS